MTNEEKRAAMGDVMGMLNKPKPKGNVARQEEMRVKKHEVAKKMSRADKVGSRKQDFTGGRQGNFMKVHKLDR